MLGKKLAKAAYSLTLFAVVTYANYRLLGGPPIKQVVKEVKQARKEREAQDRKIIYMYGEDCVVR